MASLLRCMLCVLLLRATVEVQSSVTPAEPEEDPVIVEAPSEIESEFDGYNERKQGSVAFACAELDAASPWLAYAALQSYISEGNDEGVDLSEGVVLYPLQEYYGADTSAGVSLCLYLQRQHHCYPPKPTPSLAVRVKKFFEPVFYYAVRYWGQSSTPRTDYYHGKLTTALGEAEESYDQEYFILSYYPNHVREVRVDATEEEAAPPPEDEGSTPEDEGSTPEDEGSTPPEDEGSTPPEDIDPCLDAEEQIPLRNSVSTDLRLRGGSVTVTSQDYDPCFQALSFDVTLTYENGDKVKKSATFQQPSVDLSGKEICKAVEIAVSSYDVDDELMESVIQEIEVSTMDANSGELTDWEAENLCIAPLDFPSSGGFDDARSKCDMLSGDLFYGSTTVEAFHAKMTEVGSLGGWVTAGFSPTIGWEWAEGVPLEGDVWEAGTDIAGSLPCAYLSEASAKLIPSACDAQRPIVCVNDYS